MRWPTVTRKFRGVTIETPAGAAQWPAAGVRAGILGANRQPATVRPVEPTTTSPAE